MNAIRLATYPLRDVMVRLVIASVWFYHGAINKLLSAAGLHFAIISSVPFLTKIGPYALILIALLEIALGFWVLTGYRSRVCSLVQTCSITMMNAGGLFWSNNLIPDPLAMIVNSLTFITLIWLFEFTRTR